MKPQKKFVDAAAKIAGEQGLVLDAVQTMAFARELEHIETSVYETDYPLSKARSFLPINSSIPVGTKKVTYRLWNRTAVAKIMANGANDAPRVTTSGREISHDCVGFHNFFGYTVQDIREAALTGRSVDTMLMAAAKEGHELAIDEAATNGQPEVGMPGFVNHPNVPLVTLPTGTWSSATTDQVLKDLRTLSAAAAIRTLQTRGQAVHMLLPPTLYSILQTPVGADYGDTILSVFLRSDPYCKSVEQWVKLETAGADGGPRIVCYPKDKTVVELQILMEFTQHAPQLNGFEFKVMCESHIGGVVIRYPWAMSYADNAG